MKKENNPLVLEAVCIFVIALSLFLGFCVYTQDLAGILGIIFGSFLRGLFGIGAYILPFVASVLSVYILMKTSKKIPTFKIVFSILLFFSIVNLAGVVGHGKDVNYARFTDYIASTYGGGSFKNGGLVGGIVADFLINLVGKPGAYILLTALLIASIVLVSGHSFFALVSKVSRYIKSVSRGIEPEEEKVSERKRKAPELKASTAQVKSAAQAVTDKPSATKAAATKIVAIKTVAAKSAVVKPDEDKVIEEELPDEEIGEESTERFFLKPKSKKSKHFKNSKQVAAERLAAAKELAEKLEIKERPKDYEPKRVLLINEEILGIEEPPEEPKEEELNEVQDIDTSECEDCVLADETEPEDGYEQGEFKDGIDDEDDSDEISEEYKEYEENEDYDEEGEFEEFEDYEGYEGYEFPPIDFLTENPNQPSMDTKAQLLENSAKLEETLASFGVSAKVVEVSSGPTVTRYELSPGAGVKVSRISGLADDLALSLAATGIRIEAPIPGKSAVGIEIPNKEIMPVYLRDCIDDDTFIAFPSKLAFALGKDISGNTVVADIARMPHLLIAGATGSGKSVCINTLIMSIIYKSRPDEVKLLMIDPKVVELSVYNGIPHLLIPVVTDPKKAAGALSWAVNEMVERYNCFAETSCRDLNSYNAHRIENGENPLPQIVIIIDELADLMMAAPGDVEGAICRLAQMARAAGLHLIIATQRPSVDVITGLIKANVPSRLAFAVSSGTDSRTILDMVGAERLMGKGDMLFSPVGISKPQRIQGAFISDKEVESIVQFLKQGHKPVYDQSIIDNISASSGAPIIEGEVDPLFDECVRFVISKERASASMIQRQFRLGYNRASRIIDDMELRRIVGPEDGSKPRKVLVKHWDGIK